MQCSMKTSVGCYERFLANFDGSPVISTAPRVLVPGTQQMQVSSVDGFQGKEKELIIFTAVRSGLQAHNTEERVFLALPAPVGSWRHARHKVGFLQDPRRILTG